MVKHGRIEPAKHSITVPTVRHPISNNPAAIRPARAVHPRTYAWIYVYDKRLVEELYPPSLLALSNLQNYFHQRHIKPMHD